jgi:hypothetical protein
MASIEQRNKMSDVEQLDSQIAKLETAIASRTEQLKTEQARWLDWESACSRVAIGQNQITLRNLKIRRASLAPMLGKQGSAIFYGSNF